MATLVSQQITSDGLVATYAAADVAGDDFDNSYVPESGGPFIHVKNNGGAPITVTPVITQLVDGQSVVQKAINVPAGGSIIIGLFNRTIYGTSVSLTYSSVTDIVIALLHF